MCDAPTYNSSETLNVTHTATCIGSVSLVCKNADGTAVGHVNALTDSDVTKLNDYLTNAVELYDSIEQLKNKVKAVNDKISVSSTAMVSFSPTSPKEGDLWFVYE